MVMCHLVEKLGYLPSYTRTDLTASSHETAGFRTNNEILTDIRMKMCYMFFVTL